MADKWMDDRDRQMRERDWRRSERYGRGIDRAGEDYRSERPGEARSFGEETGGYHRGERDFGERVFGERETGANYSRGTGVTPGGGAYGAGGSYGGGQSYGRGAGGGRPSTYRGGEERPAWQDRDYGGNSPAFASQDYTRDYSRGGRYYGDDARRPIYREEYGQGGVDYGPAPSGYDAQRQGSSAYGRPYGERPQYMASGGTGGYDYERGYGDAGRREDRGERFEDAGRNAGQFLHRAGERVASWFSGDRNRGEERGYREDFSRDRREMQDRGHRGLGPKGYKRSDDRINDEAHERLTDDPWLDATNISVSVSGGEVTLSGTVDNREAKHRAERLVEDLTGVNHVQNNLRIAKGSFLTSPSTGYGDSVLESQMRQDETGAAKTGGDGGQSTTGKKS